MTAVALLIAAEGPGRTHKDPSALGGIGIIVGVILAVVVLAVLAYLLLSRLAQRRRGAPGEASHGPRGVGRVQGLASGEDE